MKFRIFLLRFQAILVLSPIFLFNQPAKAEIVTINAALESDPLIITGKSGGLVNSNCGSIPNKPHQLLQLKESLPYLRITVESEDKPTLLIDGPGGRFCILSDTYSGDKPEIYGFFKDGIYKLYIGQLIPGKTPTYTLSISQQKK